MNCLLKWIGGKHKVASRLLDVLPLHRIYVETCGGAASLLCAKPFSMSKVEVYNDVNLHLYNFFRVLQDTELHKELIHLCETTPYHREVWKDAGINLKDNLRKDEIPDIQQAWYFYTLNRQSFAGFMNAWGYCISRSNRGRAGAVNEWLEAIKELPLVHERLRLVQCDCDTVFNVIQRYDMPDTFFFIDPPYIIDTRKQGRYDHEMTDEDHIKLTDMLMNIKGKAILCGYDHEIYDPLNQSDKWQRIDVARVADCAGTTKNQRTPQTPVSYTHLTLPTIYSV